MNSEVDITPKRHNNIDRLRECEKHYAAEILKCEIEIKKIEFELAQNEIKAPSVRNYVVKSKAIELKWWRRKMHEFSTKIERVKHKINKECHLRLFK